jgi:dUTPase
MFPAQTVTALARGGRGFPRYLAQNAAWASLCADLPGPLTFYPGNRKVVLSGLLVALPEGFSLHLRPHPGWLCRQGLSADGRVYSDKFRGEVAVALFHAGRFPVTVQPGAAIAELLLCRAYRLHCRIPRKIEEVLGVSC